MTPDFDSRMAEQTKDMTPQEREDHIRYNRVYEAALAGGMSDDAAAQYAHDVAWLAIMKRGYRILPGTDRGGDAQFHVYDDRLHLTLKICDTRAAAEAFITTRAQAEIAGAVA